MTWTREQRIINRAGAINRRLMEIQYYLGEVLYPRSKKRLSLKEAAARRRKPTRAQLRQVRLLNERLLVAALRLKALLEGD